MALDNLIRDLKAAILDAETNVRKLTDALAVLESAYHGPVEYAGSVYIDQDGDLWHEAGDGLLYCEPRHHSDEFLLGEDDWYARPETLDSLMNGSSYGPVRKVL